MSDGIVSTQSTTVEIKLAGGNGVAVIDACDLDLVAQFPWSMCRDRNTFYAESPRGPNGRKTTRMHRLIAGAKRGERVDHRDGNGLNNTRTNLRISTDQQNARNRSPRQDTVSRFKGVTRQVKGTSVRWHARICINGKNIRLGGYATEEEAARAYNEAAIKQFGEFAKVNAVAP